MTPGQFPSVYKLVKTSYLFLKLSFFWKELNHVEREWHSHDGISVPVRRDSLLREDTARRQVRMKHLTRIWPC